MENPVYGWGLPPDVSVAGPAIDHLIIVVHWFMAALFIGWGCFFIYCLIRFRKRDGRKASYESAHSKLPKFLEVGIVLFEVFLLVGLSYPIWSKYKNSPPPASESLSVRVIAQQFVWNFQYAGPDNQFGKTSPQFISDSNQIGLDPNDPAGKDDIITINQLHFPVHKPVIVQISSKDVIHSFAIPVLRVKQDAIPGMSIPIWFEATDTGQFEIGCAQLCGVGHSLMKGYVSIDTPEQFTAWVNEQEQALAPAPIPGSH
jgi:cytochrome c oxidase subunit 2